MVVIGVDAHKRTHTLVAVDDAGRKLGERTLAATSEGHLTRRLEGDLLAAGFAVVRVHTRLRSATANSAATDSSRS
jgi:hypothetical protein